jgi:hypothetical protein
MSSTGKCYDGNRHRWKRVGHYAWTIGNPYPVCWCNRCGALRIDGSPVDPFRLPLCQRAGRGATGIGSLNLPARVRMMLYHNGISTVGALSALTDSGLAKMRKCGPKSIEAIHNALQAPPDREE